MPFDDEQDAVYHLAFESAVAVVHLAIEHFEGPLRRVVKLRRGLVCVTQEVDEYFFDLAVFGEGKSLNKIFDPYFSVVFYVLPHEFIEILPYDEPLVADAVDDARYEHNVILFLLAILRVEDHFHDLLGNAEQFDALIYKTLLQEGRELFDFCKFPGLGLFQSLQEFLCH